MGFLPEAGTVMKGVGLTALLGLGTVGGLLYYYQTALIYPSNIPEGSRTEVPLPDEFGMPYEDVDLKTPDGVRIKAFLMLQPDGSRSRTVVLFHANAGNVGHRLPLAKVFWKNMNCNVLALSYRGYGLSEGSANEKGLRLDAQTALDYILSHPELEKSSIFVYGQSIGGAVSIDLASRNDKRIHGLIVENTFLSLPKLVPILMPYLKPFIPFLLHQIWPSEDAIKKITPELPVLFLSGTIDEMIPPSHVRGLYEASRARRKELKVFAKGTHNDTCTQPRYWATVQDFIDSVAPLPSPPSTPAPASPPLTSPVTTSEPSGSASETEIETDTEKDYDIVERPEAGSLSPQTVLKEKVKHLEEKL